MWESPGLSAAECRHRAPLLQRHNQLTSHVQAVRIFEQTEDLLLSKRVDAQSGDRTQYLVDAAAAHLHDHLTLQNRKLRSISRQSGLYIQKLL